MIMAKKGILFLFIFFISLLPVKAVETAYKIAYIDSDRILKEYSAAQDLLRDLAKAEAELNKKILAKRQEIQKAKAAKKTETEIQMMAEKIRLELEPEAKRIEDESALKSKEIEDKVDAVIKEFAKKSKYDIVVVKEAVLYGGTDVTDEILTKLKK
jgi:outer membrane protein